MRLTGSLRSGGRLTVRWRPDPEDPPVPCLLAVRTLSGDPVTARWLGVPGGGAEAQIAVPKSVAAVRLEARDGTGALLAWALAARRGRPRASAATTADLANVYPPTDRGGRS